MERLVPLTKILLTLAVSCWAIALKDWHYLLVLLILEGLLLLITRVLFQQAKALVALVGFSAFLGVLQFLGSGDVAAALLAAFRMLAMTVVFLVLLATTQLQDLTAALVTQCKVPYAYAFMFTAALRFVPDFIAESKAVQEAQACRGLSLEGHIGKRMRAYMSIVQPLMLKSLGRAETMALSLELRGFGSQSHRFSTSVGLQGKDYIVLACLVVVTIGILCFAYLG